MRMQIRPGKDKCTVYLRYDTIRYDHHVSVVLARNRHHATALHVVRTSEHWPTKHKQRENGFEANKAVGLWELGRMRHQHFCCLPATVTTWRADVRPCSRYIQQPSVSSSWSRGLERDGLLIHAGLVYSNRPRTYLKSILHAWIIAIVCLPHQHLKSFILNTW
jgi:hypothetical protein